MHLPQRLTRLAMALLCLTALSLCASTTALAGNSSFVAGDSNSLQMAIIADSYTDPPSTATDNIVRRGDTATYRLTLNLSEGTTGSLVVNVALPSGLGYAGPVAITPTSGSGPFTYTVVSQPLPGATGNLTWDLGDVLNAPSGDGTPVDALVIEFQMTTLTTPTTVFLPNVGIGGVSTNMLSSAVMSYLDAGGLPVVDPTRLVANSTLIMQQPRMSAPVKFGNGSANTATNPLIINVTTSSVQFRLRSCNSGLAPAYGVQLSDLFATQLDETSISTPVVTVGGTVLGAGDYSYSPPAVRGGSLDFTLNAPVNPGQCVVIDYSSGFHNDFGPDQLWNNHVSVDRFWSLPPATGQNYGQRNTANFYMTNLVTAEPLVKNLLAPASRAATIGEQATYQITVPGNPVFAALNNVVINDTLPDALAFVGATATLNGAPLAIVTTQVGQNLSWNIASIPNGQKAVITLTTRVDNNAFANAGAAIVNTASYSYDAMTAGAATAGSSAPLTIVEPAVTITKSVSPTTPPVAGDTLSYTVNLAAAGGAGAVTAFDTVLDDTLSLGLTYVAGSARVAGVAIEPAVSGDGVTTPQTLNWTGGIDLPAGTSATVTYAAQVLGTVVGGQVLGNSAVARWTSLAGVSADERTGSGIPASNDYVAGPATANLTVPAPLPTLRKTVDKPLANPGDRLQYTLTLQNPTSIPLAGLTLIDDLESLNPTPRFQPGSIGNVVVPAGASFLAVGSTLTVSNLDLAPNGSQTILFEANLATNLVSGNIALNQAQLTGPWPTPIRSDDPALPGSADPTRTVVPANGVVYDSATHAPLGGATVTLLRSVTATPLPTSCFINPGQQNQVTPADGTYKFDLVFDPTNCPAGADYLIAVTAVPAGYLAEESLVDLPATSAATASYSTPICPADAIPATARCEADPSATVPAGAPIYYLHLAFDATANQIYNNHIPVDRQIKEEISVAKTTPRINVTRGEIVPYSIHVRNTLRSTPPLVAVVDTLPPGFKYVSGSSRVDGAASEPVISGRQLRWDNLTPGYNQTRTVELLLMVGAGVSEGPYANQAQVIDSASSAPISEVATATVRVVPDPTLDCTDIIGKVFDDRDLDGHQGEGEPGLAGVRVATARGLIATSDAHGRFHITCAAIPDEDRGSNVILKLDDRSLPTGYRLTTENPRVQRASRGKMLRFNFGATIHRVVTLDLADGVFAPKSTTLRPQWQPQLDRLLEELRKAPSVLRLSYLADIESKQLVRERLDALQRQLDARWQQQGGDYRLDIETETFWRRGGPP